MPQNAYVPAADGGVWQPAVDGFDREKLARAVAFAEEHESWRPATSSRRHTMRSSDPQRRAADPPG